MDPADREPFIFQAASIVLTVLKICYVSIVPIELIIVKAACKIAVCMNSFDTALVITIRLTLDNLQSLARDF